MSQHQQPPLIQPSECHIHTLLTLWHIHRQCLVTQNLFSNKAFVTWNSKTTILFVNLIFTLNLLVSTSLLVESNLVLVTYCSM